MTLQRLLVDLTAAFKQFDNPSLEARHLLVEALLIDLNQLVLRGDAEVKTEDLQKVNAWRDERLKGMPLAYLSGRKAFYKSEFFVRPGVLIPRPETEFVVETALERAPESRWMADLGCGSGCIGLSLLREIPESHLIAVDSAPLAVQVTRENAANLDLLGRIEVVESSVEEWFSLRPLDLIVANPPYIALGDSRVQPSVHAFEPHAALYSGDEGLGALRSWIAKSWEQLRPGGAIVYEIGSGQSGRVQEIMREAGFSDVLVVRDLDDHERVISAFKPE